MYKKGKRYVSNCNRNLWSHYAGAIYNAPSERDVHEFELIISNQSYQWLMTDGGYWLNKCSFIFNLISTFIFITLKTYLSETLTSPPPLSSPQSPLQSPLPPFPTVTTTSQQRSSTSWRWWMSPSSCILCRRLMRGSVAINSLPSTARQLAWGWWPLSLTLEVCLDHQTLAHKPCNITTTNQREKWFC